MNILKKTFLVLTFLLLRGIIYKHIKTINILGCRQAVRQQTLTLPFRGFESFHPNQKSRMYFIRDFNFSLFTTQLYKKSASEQLSSDAFSFNYYFIQDLADFVVNNKACIAIIRCCITIY